MRYIPNSASDRAEMLTEIGVDSTEAFFAGIPKELRLEGLLDIPEALTEPELLAYFEDIASRNQVDLTSFLGGGVYPHYVPLIIDSLVSRSEFFTAYTPYQAEIAQGTLQAIFEFQTYITQLTGMDVSNASLYDGSTGLAEAILMAQRVTGRNRFLIARSVHPEYRAVVETYTRKLGVVIDPIDFSETGRVDLEELARELGSETAAVVIQSPNFFGTIENTSEIAELAHGQGALSIVNIAEAMSFGLLYPPGAGPDEQRADIVVGEAQSLGVPMSFGGPHVGYIAARSRYLRQVPGRLVGMGTDHEGHRGFVLTLATREQHIRREKATSNICTNQSLCALMTTIYLATVGPEGLRTIAEQNVLKAGYAIAQIREKTDHEVLFPSPRFNEFVVRLKGDADAILRRTREAGVVAGIHLSRFYPELADALLLCVTEVHTRNDIDRLVGALS